jgi:DNA polymerase III gamma/tau subunit
MLYQNVRPQNLDEMVGNKAVMSALKKTINKLTHEKPHVFLFTGPSGCGKTTLARILAKECGVNELDLDERNAANTRGIDTVRDIADTCKLLPMFGPCKAYIIDESHAITNAGQEAFLKILEDVPLHTFFFFCTTEPKNLITTIRNRCTEFKLSKLSIDELADVIKNACAKDNLNYDNDLAKLVAENSDGSPRKALVIYEKIKDEKDPEIIAKLLMDGDISTNPGVWELVKLLSLSPNKRKQNYNKIIILCMNLVEEEDSERIRYAILSSFLKKMCSSNSEADGLDYAYLITLFSGSTYYGGKYQLASQVARACFSVDLMGI